MRASRKGTMLGVLAAGLLLTSNVITAGTTSTTSTISLQEPIQIQFETASPYYEPPVAIVPAGRPVRWTNSTATHHSVRHDSCAEGRPCAFQSIAVPPDSSYVIGPLPPGRYSYHCALHPIMRGTLVVVNMPNEEKTVASVREAAR